MSANPPTSARIEDLRARVRLDPKSRMFYPLGEELRKIGRLDEAEKVLRDGLEHHGTYLSAWVGLGRVLVEKDQHREATEVLMKALAIDPGNVVCARLLATSYLELGDKLEAVKKLKLVRALLPADESVDEQIAALERELGEREPPAAAEKPPQAETPPQAGTPPAEEPPRAEAPAVEEPPQEEAEASASVAAPEPSPFEPEPAAPVGPHERPAPPAEIELDHPFAAASAEPETAPADIAQSPSAEEPVSPGELEDEEPFGGFDAPAPVAAASELEPETEPEPEGDLAAESGAATSGGEDLPATVTMGDLYARQGHGEAAREIYLRILERDPGNADVRRKLEALGSGDGADRARSEKAERLQRWLEKVSRREV